MREEEASGCDGTRQQPGAVAVVGAGLIGRAWALAFARGGHAVRLHDASGRARCDAVAWIETQARSLARLGLLGGLDPDVLRTQITVHGDLAEAVHGAVHVQECIAERIEAKRALFSEIEDRCPHHAVLASSTSALMPSDIFAALDRPERALVAHPLNPPHLVPAVEIVPSRMTNRAVIAATAERMAAIGQSPIVLRGETEGFVMNRLQGALLDEAFALLAEGLAGPDDVDRALRDGLARRWAFMGPFETIDLNAPDGIEGFVERYGAAYEAIGRGRPNRPSWGGALLDDLVRARRSALPADRIADRQAWRDDRLAALAAHLDAGREAETTGGQGR